VGIWDHDSQMTMHIIFYHNYLWMCLNGDKSQIDIQLFQNFIGLNLKNLVKYFNFIKLELKINLLSNILCLMQGNKNEMN
jgi:hypothetical protein